MLVAKADGKDVTACRCARLHVAGRQLAGSGRQTCRSSRCMTRLQGSCDCYVLYLPLLSCLIAFATIPHDGSVYTAVVRQCKCTVSICLVKYSILHDHRSDAACTSPTTLHRLGSWNWTRPAPRAQRWSPGSSITTSGTSTDHVSTEASTKAFVIKFAHLVTVVT